MTTYKCGKFTVAMLHYGNKQVFCRGEDGDEYLVDREFFDMNYTIESDFTCPKDRYNCVENCMSSACT